MTVEQVKQLLNVITDLRQKAMVCLRCLTGMRQGEVTNLKMADIEQSNKRILVSQVKDGKDRYIRLAKMVLENLKKLLPPLLSLGVYVLE